MGLRGEKVTPKALPTGRAGGCEAQEQEWPTTETRASAVWEFRQWRDEGWKTTQP